MITIDNHHNNVDDVQHKEGKANTKSNMVKSAGHFGVFLCYLLLSGHVGIPSLWK